MAAGLARNYYDSYGSKVEFNKNIMDGEEKTCGGCEGPDTRYTKLIIFCCS